MDEIKCYNSTNKKTPTDKGQDTNRSQHTTPVISAIDLFPKNNYNE
jgi:hypothetical protein